MTSETKGKIGKWALILSPIVILGGVAYYFIRKYSIPTKTAIPSTNSVLPKTGGSNSSSSSNQSSGCSFPLQMGSNNPCVGQLQDALGVTIDNQFGSITLAALQEQAGVSSVPNNSALQNIISTICTNDADANIALANNLISEYGQNDYSYIVASSDTTWYQVTQSNGVWSNAGYQLAIPHGLNFSLNDYQPFTSDSNTGNIIIYCNKGSNIGYWSADPSVLSFS